MKLRLFTSILLIFAALFLRSTTADELGKNNLAYATDGFKAVGQSWSPSGHCIVWDGTNHIYDYSGMPETGCYAMNNVGVGIGEAHNASTSIKFKIDLSTGVMSSLGFTLPAGATAWAAEDIDDAGNILVRYTQSVYDPIFRRRVSKSTACIASNGTCSYTYPSYPAARATYYNAFNNKGNATGIWFDFYNKQRGFIFYKETGTFQSIDYPGAIETSAVELNDYDVVAGSYCFNKPSSYCEQAKGFTWSASNFTVYDKGYSTMLTGIGNNGRVAGQVWIGNQYYKETFGFLE